MKLSTFSSTFFKHLIEYQEHKYIDYKAYLYEINDDKKKAEFLKDIIAFANRARKDHKPCFIVFGYNENNIKDPICDLRQPSNANYLDWETFRNCIPDSLESEIDYIKSRLLSVINDSIQPIPDLQILFGDYLNKIVGYIAFDANQNRDFIYELKIDVNKNKKGTAAFRIDNQCRWLEKEFDKSTLSSKWYPYIYPEQWSKYFEKYINSNFFDPNKFASVEIKFYYENPSLTPDEQILRMLSSGEKIIYLTGSLGIGKSRLMKSLTYNLASKFFTDDQHSETIFSNTDLFTELNIKIPIYVSLNKRFESKDSVLKVIDNVLKNNFEIDNNSEICFNELIKNPEYHFVIFFDGLDELLDRDHSIKVLNEFLEEMNDKVAVIISSRNYTFPYQHMSQEVKIPNLTHEQIHEYIHSNINSWYEDGTISKDEAERFEAEIDYATFFL